MIAVRTSEATTEGAEPGERPLHARRVARRRWLPVRSPRDF